MPEVKKIMISLPDTLLREVDVIVASEKVNRSEFVREAMKLYIQDRQRRIIRDEMKRGYSEMASINLSLANESLMFAEEKSKLPVWQLAEGE